MPKCLLVGCGKMGSAMLEGWLKSGIPASDIHVIEPAQSHASIIAIAPDIGISENVASIPASFIPDVVIFAVKPQIMAEIVPDYVQYHHAVFLSIAAGKTITFFEQQAQANQAVIRAMPNLPAIIGKGAMVACCNAHVSAKQKMIAEQLLAANGEVFWLDDENLMDAVTAISGSGPAYIFHFIECLEAAGKKLGLPDALATSLAYITVEGSTMLAVESDKSVGDLRIQVTSPKGTTQAALDVLIPSLQPLLEKATEAACKRSKELAG